MKRQVRSMQNIMGASLKQHGHSLDDESLQTLLCEAEGTVNNRLSLLPLTPNVLPTHKTKQIHPPPGKFQRKDVYCRRRWRRVQHITNKFWNRWSKEYLQRPIIETKAGMTEKKPRGRWYRSVKGHSFRNKWPMARVLVADRNNNGQVRSVTVQSATGSMLDQPVKKLVVLQESPEEKPEIPDEEPKELYSKW